MRERIADRVALLRRCWSRRRRRWRDVPLLAPRAPPDDYTDLYVDRRGARTTSAATATASLKYAATPDAGERARSTRSPTELGGVRGASHRRRRRGPRLTAWQMTHGPPGRDDRGARLRDQVERRRRDERPALQDPDQPRRGAGAAAPTATDARHWCAGDGLRRLHGPATTPTATASSTSATTPATRASTSPTRGASARPGLLEPAGRADRVLRRRRRRRQRLRRRHGRLGLPRRRQRPLRRRPVRPRHRRGRGLDRRGRQRQRRSAPAPTAW